MGWETPMGTGGAAAGVFQRPGPLLVSVEAGVPDLEAGSRCSWLDALEPRDEPWFSHTSLSDLRSRAPSRRCRSS